MVDTRGSFSWRRVRAAVAVLVSLCAVLARCYAARYRCPGRQGSRAAGQLFFIRQALRESAAGEAQHLFPEGYFFLRALYGPSRVEARRRLLKGAARAELLREAR